MSPSPRRLHAALALVLAASLPQCASAPSVVPVVAAPVQAAAQVEVAVDASPVALPPDAMLSLRVGTVRGAAHRLGEMLGLRDFIDEGINSVMPDLVGDDEGVARAVDLDGPLDLLVAFHDNDVEGIASFAIRSLATAREQLADGRTIEPFGNPSLRLQRVRREGGRNTDDIILAPVPGGGGGRLLMVRHRNGNEDFVNRYAAYITRTLAAQPLTSDDGALVVELHPLVLEQGMGADIDRSLGRLVERVSPGADPNNAQFADAARAWVRDALVAARSSVSEARGARISLGLGDQGVTVRFDVAVQSPSAQLAQQALTALRDSAAPMDLYERLPPGGWAYGAWSLHAEPLRATLNLGANAAARMLTPRSRLLEADATAVRTALGALVAQDRVAVASTASRDPQDRYTSTALLRLSTPSPQFVANVRTLVTTLRRPGVARAMRADLHIDPMGWTLPPTAGLPAGSLLLRGALPTLSALTTAVRGPAATTPPGRTAPPARPTPAAAAARPVLSELLLVPEGDHVWVVLGANARTQFQAASGAHAAPPAIADATAAGTSSVVAILPGALTEVFRSDASLARMIRETLAHAGAAASAPSVGRLRMTEREGVTHVSADLTVPRAALGLVGQSVQRGLARP